MAAAKQSGAKRAGREGKERSWTGGQAGTVAGGFDAQRLVGEKQSHTEIEVHHEEDVEDVEDLRVDGAGDGAEWHVVFTPNSPAM